MSGRDDPAWCTPSELPEELLSFGGTVRDGLAIGSPWKAGVLDLALAPRAGSTRVTRQFRGSRLFQRTSVAAAEDATVILGEILLPGRVAHGEVHAYDLYWAETEARDRRGALLFADTTRLRPGRVGDPRSPGVLGGYDVVATLYVMCSRVSPPDLVAMP